jgi:hypothetical protein
MSIEDIRREMTTRLLVSYRPPSHIENERQGTAVLADIVAAFVEMRPTDGEWEHIWSEFRRTWTKAYWPLPSEFCGRLTAFRARARQLADAGRAVVDMAEARAKRDRPYRDAEFQAALHRSYEMRDSRDRATAAWGALLVRLGETLARTRDENDEPRSRVRRAYEGL